MRMTNLRLPGSALVLAVVVWLGAVPGLAAERSSYFDPARHMGLDKVKRGMKGYGLTVFAENKIERFDVEIVDVVHNFGPKFDVILVKLRGHELERTGVISGMSGSPVYLTDPEDGNDKLIGAIAYGWEFNAPGPPIGGVQPIEHMLDVDVSAKPSGQQVVSTHRPGVLTRQLLSRLPGTSLMTDEGRQGRFAMAGLIDLTDAQTPAAGGLSKAASSFNPGLVPLATPLSAAGLDRGLFAALAESLGGYNMLAVAAGGAGSAPQGAPKMEPAGVLGIPFVQGDLALDGIGTITEVIGDKVWAFGHSMFEQGEIEMPISGGYIHSIIPNQMSSFKFGSCGEPIGTLRSDERAAVLGVVGKSPKMIDLSVRVDLDGAVREYNYQLATHHEFLPMLTLICAANSIMAHHNLPELHTVEYKGSVAFDGLGRIEVGSVSSMMSIMPMLTDVVDPIDLMLNNPYSRVLPDRIDLDVKIRPECCLTSVIQARTDKECYKPGETVRIDLDLQKYRGDRFSHRIEYTIPKDLPDGRYDLVLGGLNAAILADRQNYPHLYAPQSSQGLFRLVEHVSRIRGDCLYIALNNRRSGMGISTHALPDLPGSKLAQFEAADPGLVKRINSWQVVTFPADFYMSGVQKFAIDVSREKI